MKPISDITIYAPDGTILMTVPLQSNAEAAEELMRADYVQLSWNAASGDVLPAGAYIMWNGEKYSLLDPYEPEQSDELQRVYTPQFQSRVMGWGKIPFFHYNVNTATNEVLSKEPDWSLTGTGSILMQSVIDAIGRETGELWSIEVDESLNNGTQTVSFESTDIFSGLNAIASAFEAEWWADKTKTGGESGVIGSHGTIYLARRIALGEPVALTVGDNVGVPSVTEFKEGYYNRFFIFGSTRNVTQDFDGANVNTLVNKRLTLDPVKYPDSCIDMRIDKDHEPALTKFLVFDDIYPRAHLKISDVANGLRARTMYRLNNDTQEPIQLGTDANGKPIYDQYVIWYFRPVVSDTGKEFSIANPTYYNPKTNPTGDLIPGKNLSVHFNSGMLNGREFELHYVDKDDTIQGQSIPEYGLYTPDFPVYKGDFEIKITEEGSMIIPTGSEGGVSPTEGDQLTLFNLRMPVEYTASSQKDLEDAANDTIAERYTADLNNYTLQSNPVAFHADDPNLTVGRAVTYINGDYSYTTRVIRIVRKLDSPKLCEQEITIGSEKIKGTTQTLKEDVVIANRNIEVLAALNSLTDSITQQYMRTQQSMLEGFRRISDMWRFDPDDPNTIYSKYNVYSLKSVTAKGRYSGDGSDGSGGGGSLFGLMREWPTANPGNATTDALGANLGWELRQSVITLQNAGYATQTWVQQQGYLTQHQDISHLLAKTEAARLYQPKGDYLTQHQTLYELTVQRNGVTVGTFAPGSADKTINISDVASAAALAAHVSDAVVHITATERSKWNKTSTDLSAILGTDSDTIINKWEEVIAFLATYTEADTLANLLSNKADKATTLAGYGITDAYTKTQMDGRYARLAAPNNLIHSNNEFTFIPDGYNNVIWLNYSAGVAGTGAVSQYNFGDGSKGGYAPVVAKSFRMANGTASQFLMANGSIRELSTLVQSGSQAELYRLTIQSGVDAKLVLNNTDDEENWSYISFRQKGTEVGTLGFKGASQDLRWNTNKILHEGNYATILDTRYLTKATFDDLFEKKNIGTAAAPVWVIHAKYGLYSDYSITAKGEYTGGTGDTGGGNSYGRLDSWEAYVAGSGDVLSADLGYGLHTGLDMLTAKVNTIKGLDAGIVSAGTYTKVTTDTYGRVVAGSTLTVADIPALPWSKITSGKPTTLAGYGIADGLIFAVYPNYVAARFATTALAQKAADTYIELWQSSAGWFNLKAGKFITDGGTASMFVKGDGSLDTTVYATAASLDNYVTRSTAQEITGKKTFKNYSVYVQHGDVSTGGSALGLDILNHDGSINGGVGTLMGSNNTFRYTYLGWGSSPWAESTCLAVADSMFQYKGNNVLHAGNYSSILDSRYYTESEINAKLTNGSVTKLGTSTIGSSIKPIYLSGGVPTACSYAFGNGSGNAALNNGTLNTNLNADLLDGLHAGYNNNRVAVFCNFPTWAQLISDGYLESDYAALSHPAELYFKALCKWLIATHSGNKLFIGEVTPSSAGFVHIHVYNSGKGSDGQGGTDNGADADLPRYCSGVYYTLTGHYYGFRVYEGVWYWLDTQFKGNATTADRLKTDNSYTAWGQTFFANGIPRSISGDMTEVRRIYNTAAVAPYLHQAAIPASVGNLGTAIGIGLAPSNYGMFMWGDGSGRGHIQVGRNDGTQTAYNLILQEFGGNVGIGTTSPAYKLDVNGSTRIAGALTGVTDITMTGAVTSGSVKFGRNGSVMELLSGTNEFVLSMGGNYAAAYINYRTSTYGGRAPAKWVWNAGTPTTYADFDLGALNVRGDLTLAVGKQLKSGTGAIEWDAAKGMWKFTGGIYSDGPVTAKGSYSGSGSAGGGNAYGRYDDATWTSVPAAEDVLAATLGVQLNNRVKALEGKNYLDALTMVQSGSGNAVTSVTLSADKKIITVTKGNHVDVASDQEVTGAKTFINTVTLGRSVLSVAETSGVSALPSAILPMGIGTQLEPDPTFSNSVGGLSRYNNAGNTSVTLTRIDDNQNSGNLSGKILEICTNGTATPGLGGFVPHLTSRANAVFLQLFYAKIPVGYSVMNAENSMGSGYRTVWLTSRSGTGKWAWYARLTYCGNSGTFSSGGHVYLTGAAATAEAPVRWYLAYHQCFDMSRPAYQLTKDNYASVLDSRYYTESEINTKLGSYYTKTEVDAKNYIKDRTNGTATYLNYGAAGVTTASWLAAWNGYELRAMSPANVLACINAVSKTGDTMTGALTVPRINESGTLVLNGGSGLYLRYADKDAASLVLSSVAFKPFDAANGVFSLGSASSRWTTLYANSINVTSTALVSNLNADLLDGVHASELARGGTAYYAANDGTGSRWIRIATFSHYVASGIITIENTWAHNANAAVVFAFGVGHRGNGNYSITQIGGTGALFSKARIVYPTETTEAGFIEVYYNESASGHNHLNVRLANAINTTLIQSATAGSIPSTHAAYEQGFTINGIAALNVKATAFTGPLKGNADTATKLATARTINGTSFDGSANITTSYWGAARNVYVQDHTGSHVGGAVSVNGSAAVRLKLPSMMDLATLNVTTAVRLNGTSAMLRGTGKYGGFNLYAGYSVVANEIFRIDGENPDGTFACNIMKSDISGNVAFGPSNVDAAYRLLVDGMAKTTGTLKCPELTTQAIYMPYTDRDVNIQYDEVDEVLDIDAPLRVPYLIIGDGDGSVVIKYNKTTGMLEVTKGITSHGAITAKEKR